MSGEDDMNVWTDLLNSSTKLFEQSAPSAQFPPLQRNIDQLEALSKKLKAKTLRVEAPSHSIAATRLLAREGINAEQLARDLKSFELKTTFEDVFPAEAATVEEYLQQIHEMAMVSSVQEAQKDNLRSFNDHMMHVIEDDWQKEKRDFLQSITRLSSLPRTSSVPLNTGETFQKQNPTLASQISVGKTNNNMDIVPIANIPILERKASVYADVVKHLNNSREHGIQFKPATAFRNAYNSLELDVSEGKNVSMQKIWHLVQALVAEDGSSTPKNVSKKMSLVIGGRHHLEWGHEKFIMDTIQSHPAQASLGGVVGNLQKIRAFLRVCLRDHGTLDFDASEIRRQPPVDTTWQQIFFCLRTGYYDEARNVAQSSRAASQFAPLLAEWISTGGIVSHGTAVSASEECEKMLRMGDRSGRSGYDKKKLLLYAIVSGCRRQIDRLLREFPTLFNTIEDFLWFKLAAIHDFPSGASSVVLSEGFVPYTLDDLQGYLNKFEPSYYTKNGKDPLVYPYVLLLSIQLLPAILYLSKETEEKGYNIDAVHISVCFSDHGVLSVGAGLSNKLGVLDIYGQVAGIIKHFGSAYMHQGNNPLALEYYAQAAATMGGGQLSWSGRGNTDHQRQQIMMLKQLLTEILLCDGGISLLLGARGSGEEGSLRRFFSDRSSQQQLLLEAAQQSLHARLYDKSVEIHRRVGAFAMALDTTNKCLSEAICSLFRGRMDGESQTASLIQSGDEIAHEYTNSADSSSQERESIYEQLTVLRQLQSILDVQKFARNGQYIDALREISKLSFLPLDPRTPNSATDIFQNLSPHVQLCVPDLLKLALNISDHVKDSDGTVRGLRSKISSLVANNMARNWPHDLYEKVAQCL